MTSGEGVGVSGAEDQEPAQPLSPAAGPSAGPAGHKRRRPGPVIKALMVLTLLGFIAPFIALLIAHQLGNGAGGGTFPVNVRNDSTVPLTLSSCPGECAGGGASGVLTPGATLRVAVSDRGVVTRYYLLNGAKAAVGCLPLRFSKAVPGLTVNVSQAVACPGDPLPQPSGG